MSSSRGEFVELVHRLLAADSREANLDRLHGCECLSCSHDCECDECVAASEDRAAGWRALLAAFDEANQHQAAVERVRKVLLASDDGTEWEHEDKFCGSGNCPGCWAETIQTALDGHPHKPNDFDTGMGCGDIWPCDHVWGCADDQPENAPRALDGDVAKAGDR